MPRAKADRRKPCASPHGTRSRYNGGGCRCLKCRAANTAYSGAIQRAARAALRREREGIDIAKRSR